jgi:hypothetical protein
MSMSSEELPNTYFKYSASTVYVRGSVFFLHAEDASLYRIGATLLAGVLLTGEAGVVVGLDPDNFWLWPWYCCI